MRSIVTAVYDVKPGEVWPEESHGARSPRPSARTTALMFDVVGIHPRARRTSSSAADNVRRAASRRVLRKHPPRAPSTASSASTYNFMPVFDWTRTQLDKKAPDGCTSLVMYWDQMNGLDPLKRRTIHLPGWDASSYSQEEVTRAHPRLRRASARRACGRTLEHFLQEGHSRWPRTCGVAHGHPSGRSALSRSSACPASSPAKRTSTAS